MKMRLVCLEEKTSQQIRLKKAKGGKSMTVLRVLLWIAVASSFIGAIVAYLNQRYSEGGRKGEYGKTPQGGYRRVKGLIIIGLFLLILAISSQALVQVNPGYRGVVVRMGAVTQRTIGEGLHTIMPLIERAEMMSVQVQAYPTEAAAASRDLQDVKTTITLNYFLDPLRVNEVYQKLRQEYEDRIIKPAVQEAVKSVTAKFDAEELITRRPDVKDTINTTLQKRLEVHGMIVDTLSITNFEFSGAYTKAIEAKVVAAQQALEAENLLRRIEVEARQVEVAAKGQANAAIAQAHGDAKSIQIRAEAQAAANNLINASLTDMLIRYNLAINIAPGVQTIILPAGQQFILGPEILGK